MDANGLTIIRVAYNHETNMVAIEAAGIPLCLAQMIIFEAAEQLRILRARAAQMDFQREAAEAQKVAAILGNNRPRG